MADIPERILLATDGSADARLAARAAADLTTRSGAALHVVHAWQPANFHPEAAIMPESAARLREAYERGAGELLAAQVREIEAAGGAVAEGHLRSGSPASEIVALAGELGAGLVLIGSRGLGGVKRLVLGSVSEGVVQGAPCPVLVTRGGEGAWPPTRIVLGEDGSGDAERAGRLAAGIGNLLGAELVVVHAYPQPTYLQAVEMIADPHVFADAQRETGRIIRERADALAPALGRPPDTRVVQGEPAAAILSEAEEGGPALIAVGSRGLGALERMRVGSVSATLLRSALCPVLVAPHGRGGG